jgi:hypothetical protein
MQTVRDLIKYVCQETVDYLNKYEKLKTADPFLSDKLVNKFLNDNKIVDHKNKNVLIAKPRRPIRQLILPKLNDFEVKLTNIICQVHGVSYEDLYSPIRRGAVVDARRQFTSFLYTYIGYTYTRVATMFGKDHSTIIHNVRTHQDLLETDSLYIMRFGKFMDIIKEEFPEILSKVEERRELYREFQKVHAERSLSVTRKTIVEEEKV